MSFNYSGDPSTSTVDQVRFLIQDTTSPGLLQDEEIAWLLTEEGGAYPAAVEACRVLARKYAGKPGSRSIGDVSISYSDLTTRYNELATVLQNRSSRTSVPTPYLGGLSQADKEANDANDDHSRRAFSDEDFPPSNP